MFSRLKFKYKRLALLLLLLCALTLIFVSWRHFAPVTASGGWSYRVYRDNVPMVSALFRDDGGALYLTLEHNHQKGALARLTADGKLQEILGGLDKPDGLAWYQGGILLSQEGGEYPVLWIRGERIDALFKGQNIEGIDTDARHVYAIEDVKGNGRLWRYDAQSGRMEILRDGLVEAEGVAVCPDGRLFYAEKKKGWVKLYRPEAREDPVIAEGLNAPGFLLCREEGLWIAEDATHAARLLLIKPGGVPQVILDHLRSAQTVLPIGPGRFIVAEQGRNRILELESMADDRQ